MNEASDSDLLREFAVEGSEAAFESLVERHVNLVYSAALRQVGQVELAKDVSQAVFIILARKAHKLGENVILPAWLYRTTRFAGADVLKAERRRINRELDATMMERLTAAADPFWDQVAPHLDDALEKLSEKDRTVIVLRFFDKQNFRAIGEALGTTDDSAQKRITRALDKLRGLLRKRGVTLSTAVLSGTIMTHSVQAAPTGIVTAVAGAAADGAAIGASVLTIAKGTLKMMLWNKMKLICAWSAPVLMAVGAVPLVVDDFKPTNVRLDFVARGGNQAISGKPDSGFYPQRILFQTNKSTALRRAPIGLEAPLYGQFSFGPMEQRNAILVLLDEPEGKLARLWVDQNGNGDLTDDPLPEWTMQKVPLPDKTIAEMYSGDIMLSVQAGGLNREFGLKMYRSFRGVQYPLWYYRDYARTGFVTLNGQKFRAALSDDLVLGDYRGDPNRQPGSGVSLRIDLDGDGLMVRKRERFDVAKPFNIRGTTYEITGLSTFGETFNLVKSRQKVAEGLFFEEGDTLTPFEKTTLDGRKVSFPKDYKGKLVLIDFWATWCSPCVAEVPNMRAAHAKFRDQGFEILGVSLDNAGQQEKLANFTKSKGIVWPQLYDGKAHEGDLAKLIGVGGVPHVLLVDGDSGKVLATTFDLIGAKLNPTLEQALEKKAAKIRK